MTGETSDGRRVAVRIAITTSTVLLLLLQQLLLLLVQNSAMSHKRWNSYYYLRATRVGPILLRLQWQQRRTPCEYSIRVSEVLPVAPRPPSADSWHRRDVWRHRICIED